uniref:ABC-type xenobiotic transporter n=1 Tax=Palaemon carinicauda TaxID=392227 RepID=A0A5P9L9M3_PALCI|nr:P-glycoprotein [Palaemon carinicauda]
MVSASSKEPSRQNSTSKKRMGHTKIDVESSEKDINKLENGLEASKEKDSEKEKKKEDELPPVSILSLFRYATPFEKFLIFVGLLAAILSAACLPIMFILFGNVTDAFVYNAMQSSFSVHESNLTQFINNQTNKDFFTEVVIFGGGTIGIGAGLMIFGYVFVTTLNYAAEGQVCRLRGMFLHSILKQEIGWFDTHQTNDFASRVTEDLNKLQEGIGEKIGMFTFFMGTFLISLVNAFVHGWLLTLIIISVFPVLGLSTGIIAKAQSKLSSLEMKEYARAGSIAEEVLSAIRTVVAFGGEHKEVERFNNNLIYAKQAGIKRGLVTGIGMGLMWFIIYAAYALAFYYGTGLIIDSRPPHGDGSYEPSNLIIVFFSVLMGAMNVGQSAPYVEAFNVARGAAATIFDIVERKSAIDPTSKEGKKPTSVTGTIELKNIIFNYPSRPDVPILQGASFHVEPGQTVALVGASGCGKSTCIQLVQRFYDPLSGIVMLDGEDIRQLNIGWLRDQIGVVGQEPVLFATTIAENIRLGRPSASMEDIEAAAKEANAHNFIMKLPKKYETNVGERGAQMSGGQKQRIAIARALVKQPRVLLLDEATSALDNQSEAIVQKALDKVRKGRTTIVVAHRLSTIKTADKIVVFNEGKIVEKGTHDDLMALKSNYYNLVMAQISPSESQKAVDIKEADETSLSNLPDVTSISDLTQDIMDDLTTMSPATLTRSPSARLSLRRRRASSVKSAKGASAHPKEEDEYQEVSTFKIMKMNSTEWPFMVGGVLGAAVQGTMLPIYAILFGEVFGTLSIVDEDEARAEANHYALLFLILGIIAAISMFFQAYMFSLSGEILTSRLRKLSFASMLRQEMGWFDQEKNSVGSLCSRLSGDASAVQGATGSRIGTVVQAVTTLGVSTGLALYYDWRLGLVSFPFIPLTLIAVYLQSKILMGQSVTESKVLEEAGKLAIDSITNIRTVASLHKEEHFSSEYSLALLKPHREALKKSHLRGATFGFAQSMPFYAYGAMMFYGGYLISVDEIDYERVFKVTEAFILGAMMVGQAMAFAPNYSKAKVAASKIFHLLQRKSEIDASTNAGLRLSGPVEQIELRDVHFAYPTRPTTSILQGLSITVTQGQTLALVGSSGCGKSTIIGLLERFYNAHGGKVNINGQEVQSLSVSWIRSQFGLVSQEPILFDMSIAENIAYGDNSRKVTKEEIVAAAKQANIHAFIDSLPNKYETRVGAKGSQLSGGQKQRVAIARALVRNPSVLLLDEATSALDTESEKVVQEALEQAQKGRTSIIIAHRLSTVQGADVIAVVQGGTIMEIGSHSDLMQQKGEYYQLYQTHN